MSATRAALTGMPPRRALPTMTVRAQPDRYSVKEPLSKKPDSHSPCTKKRYGVRVEERANMLSKIQFKQLGTGSRSGTGMGGT